MPKLRNMLGETGTIEIPVDGDDPLVVTYRRGILTPRLQKRMAEVQARIQAVGGDTPPDDDTLDFMVSVYARLIDSWNLTDDNGQVIGTDAEAISDVDFGILNLVMTEIGRSMNADPLSASGSSNGSSLTGDSGPRPIGLAS